MTQKVEQLLRSFQSVFAQAKPDIPASQKLLSQLKVALLEFQLVPPFTAAENEKQLLLAREVWEQAIFLSIAMEDVSSFERHVAQVKPFYYDYSRLMDSSERKWQILGLLLLHLLSQNRMGEFHTELELIPLDDQKGLYIDFPIQLEKRLMEGTYNKILLANKDVPSPSYSFFMNKLANTMREKIAECEATVYKHGLSEGLSSPPDAEDGSQQSIPSYRLIQESLLYATELERII